MIRFHSYLAPMMEHQDAVKPDPLNPNNGDIDAIVESVTVNGCYRPVYAAKETGHIVGGHNLYAALLEMGAHYIPVAWLDGNDEQARRILAADNRIARLARMDDALLIQLLNPLKETDLGLAGTGYSETDVERITASAPPPFDGPWLPSRGTGEKWLSEHTCPECGHTWSD